MLSTNRSATWTSCLRDTVRTQIHQLHHSLGFSAVFVTHDQREALALGDRLAIMKAGKLEQLETPQRVFDEPARSTWPRSSAWATDPRSRGVTAAGPSHPASCWTWAPARPREETRTAQLPGYGQRTCT